MTNKLNLVYSKDILQLVQHVCLLQKMHLYMDEINIMLLTLSIHVLFRACTHSEPAGLINDKPMSSWYELR